MTFAQTFSAEVRINYLKAAITTIKITYINVETIFTESITLLRWLRALFGCKYLCFIAYYSLIFERGPN
jgi:hypothetical protein